MIAKFAGILLMLFLIAGCRGGSDGSSGSSSGSSAGTGSLSLNAPSGGSDAGSGDGIHLVHNPEPATVALLGVGLAGLFIAKLKKKR